MEAAPRDASMLKKRQGIAIRRKAHALVGENRFHALADVLRQHMKKPAGPVLFKSCGWAGWDLAAARVALR
jgi:ornithine cyclodeaminase/alanine dehydrogenase-like protein (mu-crystallin family)